MPSEPAVAPNTPMAARLADFALSTRWDDIEGRVRHEVKRSFLNWLGCAIGGSQHESIAIALNALLPVAGAAQATVIGRRQRTDMLTASLLNCTSSSVHGFDDTHAETILHPTGPVATALQISLPYAAPYVFTGVKLAVAYSFIGVIGAELIMSRTGLGYEIGFAYNNFDNAVMYPLIVLVLAIATSVNTLFFLWEKRMLARRRR